MANQIGKIDRTAAAQSATIDDSNQASQKAAENLVGAAKSGKTKVKSDPYRGHKMPNGAVIYCRDSELKRVMRDVMPFAGSVKSLEAEGHRKGNDFGPLIEQVQGLLRR
jgi:hypothetical protein